MINCLIKLIFLVILLSSQTNAETFNRNFLLKGLKLEQTTLKEAQNLYELKSGWTSSLGLMHSALLQPDYKLYFGIDEPYILRGISITYPLNKFSELSQELAKTYGNPKIDKTKLKTFFVDNFQIELSTMSTKAVLEFTSIKFRNERIEAYKILARKGYPLYQDILKSINETY